MDTLSTLPSAFNPLNFLQILLATLTSLNFISAVTGSSEIKVQSIRHLSLCSLKSSVCRAATMSSAVVPGAKFEATTMCICGCAAPLIDKEVVPFRELASVSVRGETLALEILPLLISFAMRVARALPLKVLLWRVG